MKQKALLLALLISAANMWAASTAIDTTHVSVSVCQSELPYTYEPTGTVFPKGLTGIVDSVVVKQNKATHIHLTIVPNPELNVRPDTVVTKGDSALLWVTGAEDVKWTSNSPIVQSATLEYYAKPDHSDMYYVSGYRKTSPQANLVVNGDFEQGNTGFSTQLTYLEPYTRYGKSGEYTIADDLKGYWLDAIDSHKAYGGVGNMFIVDGATTPNTIVWEQTVAVVPNTYYVFSAQEMSCWDSYKQGQYALLQFSVNGVGIGEVFHSPTTQYQWEQFYDVWYSGTSTTATLRILNQNNSDLGNDYALDEIRFEPVSSLCESEDSVLIIVYKYKEEAQFKCASELPFTWNKKVVDKAGVYKDTIVSSTGYCDSIVTLTLTTSAAPISYVKDTVVCDTVFPITWRGVLFTKPGVYRDTLTDRYDCDSVYRVFTLDTVMSPEPCISNLVYRKWDDVIFCDNGQSKIIAYQWYRDNQQLSGETKQYFFHQGGIDGAEYFVEITYTDGTKHRTCPQKFVATPQSAATYVNIQTVVARGGILHIAMSDSQAEVVIYSVVGQPMLKTTICGQDSELPIDFPEGIYVLNLISENVKKTTKIKVE